MSGIQTSFQDLVHLFFPHVCTGCGSDILNDKQLLCLHCLSELPETNFFYLPHNPVEKIFYGRIPVRSAAAGYFFTKNSLIQTLLHRLKYKGNKEIGFYFGKLLSKFLMNNERFSGVDALVPLPLNPRREKKRGYNQSVVICEGITSAWKKPVLNNAVIRKVYTETQTQRGRITRWENMDGVFAVSQPEALENKHIMLVDDLVTTGASLEACGSELLKVRGTTLSIATLGYTL
ncbi:MAG: ComF family protein [Segetibacter sp.]|nr:ComF family protein [Segetibacter sp.]